MKILYLITKSNWGGAQRNVFDLAVYHREKGYDVVVALGGEGLLRDRLRERGVTTRPIGSLARDLNLLKDTASLGDIFKIIRSEKPDILHLHSPKAAGLGALVGRLLRVKKIIYTVHGWTFNEDRPIHQRMGIILTSWITMLLCTRIITISKKDRSQAEMFPLVSDKLGMIHVGIAPPRFFSVGSARQMLQSKTTEPLEKKVIIGTIAELHKNKGLIYAIEAVEKLVSHFPSFIFFIIGEGEERSNIEEMIRKKKLGKHVILTGYIENASEYLKGLSIFLLTSIKEGLPYCLIEAGYAGLPIISTTVGGIPDIIDDMNSGILIQPKKSEEVFHALYFLIKHKIIQREYAKKINEKVRADFNLDRMLAETSRLYD